MPILTFPLAKTTFWSKLRIQTFAALRLGGGLQQQNTGGGEIIGAATGQRLWEGKVELVANYDHPEVEALLVALQDPGRSFMVETHDRLYPLADPGGARLGTATPVIASLPSGGRSMTLSGLPDGYILTPGDYIGFTRGSPTRFELVEVLTGAVANGSGVTPEFDVTPGIRPGTTVGASVTLARPGFRAVLVPGSLQTSEVQPGRNARQGPAFSFRQTLTRSAT